jgi:amphi-Trp domain-containing protein
MTETETEEQRTRREVATYLRDVADQFDGEEPLTLELGGESVTLDLSDPITFKLEGESDTSGEQAKQSIEMELVWWEEPETAESVGSESEPT